MWHPILFEGGKEERQLVWSLLKIFAEKRHKFDRNEDGFDDERLPARDNFRREHWPVSETFTQNYGLRNVFACAHQGDEKHDLRWRRGREWTDEINKLFLRNLRFVA